MMTVNICETYPSLVVTLNLNKNSYIADLPACFARVYKVSTAVLIFPTISNALLKLWSSDEVS